MKTQNKQGSEQQNVFGSGTPFPSQSCSGGGMPSPYNGCFRQTTMPPWPPARWGRKRHQIPLWGLFFILTNPAHLPIISGKAYERTVELMKMERIDRVRAALCAQGLTQMIVCDPKSVWYLTGVAVEPYERLLALYLPTNGEPVLFLNKLFNVPSPPCKTVWHTDTDAPVAQIAAVVDAAKPLGIDKEWPAKFLIPLMEAHPGMQVVLSSDCVDDCRACKDAEEQRLMREASRINDEVNEAAKHYVKVGMTEREVAEFIDAQFRAHGCEGPSFTTIVSFGANAADPHHEPDGTVLKEGDCVLFDMGCVKDRYCSDMTRTWFCGQPTEKQAAVHDLVRRANEAAEALIKPGVRLCDLDAAARDLIAEAGYGEYFNHRLGHFIGQTDHEKGDVSSANTAVAKPGMIFSIEPGIYLPGEFGVRVEDLVLVTEDGCEVLNHNDKHWDVVGK